MATKHVHFGWVVTHRDQHDDDETTKRAITDYASNAATAWSNFLMLVCHELVAKKVWISRGYVARRVKIVVTIESV